MKEIKISRFISVGGILTAFTVLFQSAPVFLPTIGLVLSPISTLPIALAAVYSIPLGILVLISSVLLLILVSPQEAIILLFTTGLLGIIMGTLLCRKGIIVSILASTILLFSGMAILTYLVGLSVFGELTGSLPFPIITLFFILFAFVYVSIWNLILSKLVKSLSIIN